MHLAINRSYVLKQRLLQSLQVECGHTKSQRLAEVTELGWLAECAIDVLRNILSGHRTMSRAGEKDHGVESDALFRKRATLRPSTRGMPKSVITIEKGLPRLRAALKASIPSPPPFAVITSL